MTSHRSLDQLLQRADDILGALRKSVAEEETGPGDPLYESLEELDAVIEQLSAVHKEQSRQLNELAALGQELEARQKRYWDIFQFAPDAYLITDTEGTILEANRAAESLVGMDCESLKGKSLAAYVAEEMKPRFFQMIADAGQRSPDQQAYAEMTLRPQDGATFPVSVTAAPAHEDGEASVRWLMRDTSERKQREQERERLFGEVLRERRRAEGMAQEAQAANKLLGTLLEALPVGVIVCDSDGALLMTNRAGREILGTRVAGSVDRPARDYTPHYPDGSPFPIEQMPLTRAIDEGKVTQNVEILIRRADRTERTILSAGAPVLDDAGNVLAAVTVFQDITERQGALRQLEQERSRLGAILESAPVGIVVADSEGRILHTNRVADELYARPVPIGEGYESHSELILCYPDGTPYAARDLPLTHAALDREESRQVEMMIVWPDGQRRDLLASASPVIGTGGENLGAVGIFQDITSAKQIERERQRLLVEASQAKQQAEETAQALREERDVIETIMESTHAQLAYLDREFRFLRVNSAYARGTGYSKEQLLGCDHFELFPHQENQAIFERVRDTGQPAIFYAKPFTFRDRPELGTTYWDWSLVPVKDEDGTARGLVLSLIDVTGRQQVQRALRLYADRLELLHDLDRRILAARSASEIAQLAVGHLGSLITPLRASVFLCELQAEQVSLLAVYSDDGTELKTGWKGPMSWVWFCDDISSGQRYEVQDLSALPSSLSPLLAQLQTEGVRGYTCLPLVAQGELIGALSLGREKPGGLSAEELDIVTEIADQLAVGLRQMRLLEAVQQHAERLEKKVARRTATLRASEARFCGIFENAALGIALLNRKGRIVASNPALQEMLGYSAQELRGSNVTDFSDRDPSESHLLRELLVGERERFTVQREYLRKDGLPIILNITVSSVRDAWHSDRLRFVVALAEDVTEQKKTEAALIQSEKLAVMGRLAASLAHEINNPMQSVIGCLGLAQESLEEGEDIAKFLDMAMEELRRAARIVARLRDLGRPSRPEDREATDIVALLERVLDLSGKQCRSRRLELELQAPKDLAPLHVVPDRIQQVFLNLALNAVDALEDGGRLTVRVDSTIEPHGVRIAFTDDGPGIEQDILRRLFEPFFSTKSDGMGLGLFVSQSIVEEHGGHIEVESQIGKGTTFTVWLPA